METSGPTSGIPRQLAGGGVTAVQWQVGQLLQATVTENGIGKVLLAIGNRQVSAETSLHLEKGQQLTLQVRSMGEQPVLRVTTGLNESPVAMAVRLLLPKQGPLTPLLSNMGQLAATPNPPTPALINELVHTMVKQTADVQTVSTPQGLKKAVMDSGVFLERQLLQSQRRPSGPVSLDTDFKANLLRLVQLVRNWPGSTQTAVTPQQSATAAPSPTTAGSLPATPVLQHPVQAPGGAQARPPAIPSPSAQGASASPTADKAAATTPAASPEQVQRAIKASIPAASAGGARSSATVLPGATSAAAGAGGGPAAATPSVSLTATPPPFRGSVPVPQSAVQTSLDLMNRLGNFRTDLLQQAEAALARVQMNQLAAVPREGERGLLEWLFEIPVRRGEDIDLWSMRVYREPQQQSQEDRQTEPGWSVQLAFDLPGLGPLQAQVQLAGEQVSTRFWAAQTETLPLLREHMDELRQALNKVGLEVGKLECRPGPRTSAGPGSNQPLISEKA